MRGFWSVPEIILDVILILTALILISTGKADWTDYFTVFGLIAMWFLERIIRKKRRK